MTKNKKYPKPQVIGFMPMVSDGNEIWGFEISELSKEEQHDLKKKVCPKCQGDGKVWADGRKHYPFAHFPTKDCPECRGRGTLIDRLEPQVDKAYLNFEPPEKPQV